MFTHLFSEAINTSSVKSVLTLIVDTSLDQRSDCVSLDSLGLDSSLILYKILHSPVTLFVCHRFWAFCFQSKNPGAELFQKQMIGI